MKVLTFRVLPEHNVEQPSILEDKLGSTIISNLIGGPTTILYPTVVLIFHLHNLIVIAEIQYNFNLSILSQNLMSLIYSFI